MAQMTKHYINRASLRMDMNKREAKKRLDIVLKNGVSSDTFDGRRAEYLSRREKDGHYTLVYQDCVYIFTSDDMCVTAYQLPDWFTNKDIKTENGYVRNYYKYYKYNLESKYDFVA